MGFIAQTFLSSLFVIVLAISCSHLESIGGFNSIEFFNCTSTSNCTQTTGLDDNYTCVDNQCRCAANYRYDPKLKRCQPFTCTPGNDKECQEYDRNRLCEVTSGKPQCDCKNNYKGNGTNGGKCYQYTRYKEKCTNADDCGQSASNLRCVDGTCLCNPDYKLQNGEGCIKMACTMTADCYEEEDPDRECIQTGGSVMSCVCKEHYGQNWDNGNKCELLADSGGIVITWSTWWIYVVILVAWSFFLVCLIICCYKFGKHKKRRYYTERMSRQTFRETPRSVSQEETTNRLPPINTSGEYVRSNSVPYSQSGATNSTQTSTNQNNSFNFDILQLLALFRPTYYEPPPSYDSIPGTRPQADNVQTLNVTQLQTQLYQNPEYFELRTVNNTHATQHMEPIYENFAGGSNHADDDHAQIRPELTKQEQLAMQL